MGATYPSVPRLGWFLILGGAALQRCTEGRFRIAASATDFSPVSVRLKTANPVMARESRIPQRYVAAFPDGTVENFMTAELLPSIFRGIRASSR
jgi:hypothetical protein